MNMYAETYVTLAEYIKRHVRPCPIRRKARAIAKIGLQLFFRGRHLTMSISEL
jgi:hypothetical protein